MQTARQYLERADNHLSDAEEDFEKSLPTLCRVYSSIKTRRLQQRNVPFKDGSRVFFSSIRTNQFR